jgi:hypothetical protein
MAFVQSTSISIAFMYTTFAPSISPYAKWPYRKMDFFPHDTESLIPQKLLTLTAQDMHQLFLLSQ